MSSDVDQFVSLILSKGSYYAYTTVNNLPIDRSFDFVLTVLHDDLGFENQAVVVPYEQCYIIELSKAKNSFTLVLYEGSSTSALLIDKHFPDPGSLVVMLNQCMLAFWLPVIMDTALMCGTLITFTDGSLSAVATYVNDPSRISLSFGNIFVEQALLKIERDDHLKKGLCSLQESLRAHLNTLKMDLPALKRLKIKDHLRYSKKKFRLFSADDAILFIKFLADFAELRNPIKYN